MVEVRAVVALQLSLALWGREVMLVLPSVVGVEEDTMEEVLVIMQEVVEARATLPLRQLPITIGLVMVSALLRLT